MKTIELTHGKVAIVDDEDYPELAGYRWTRIRGTNEVVARRRPKGARV